MSAKVIASFRDKETLERYNVGSKYEGTEERLAELAELGYLELGVSTEQTTKTEEEGKKSNKK